MIFISLKYSANNHTAENLWRQKKQTNKQTNKIKTEIKST